MLPTITPDVLGFTSYTVSGSGSAFFYLDIALGLDDTAEFQVSCPASATLTLTEGSTPPIALLTTGTIPTHDNGVRTVDSSAAPGDGGAAVVVTITALEEFASAWVLRLVGMPPAATAVFDVLGGDVQIVRVLADPVVDVSEPAAPLPEKEQITLTGEAGYTTVPHGPGTPAPPLLRARWSQTGPATVDASPPNTPFTASVDTAPLDATLSARGFTAPGVYAEQEISYRLTAFYDDHPDTVPDPTEPAASADLTLTVHPRSHHLLLLLDRSGSMLAGLPGAGLDRFDFARRAAHVWTDAWTALRRGVGTDDTAGILVFEAGACSWTGQPAQPVEILHPPSGTPGGIDELDAIALDLGAPGSCTPIGDALIAAIDTFADLGRPVEDRYVVLLLTDGYENAGAVVVEDDTPVPPGATRTFDSARVANPRRRVVSERLVTYTVGLGPSGSVQESVLADLTDNAAHRGLYRRAQSPVELTDAFGEFLGHALDAQNITPPEDPGDPFTVTGGEHRLLMALTWGSSTDRMKVYRTVAGGTEQQVAGPGAVATDGVTERSRAEHGFVDVDLGAHLGGTTTASTWRVEYWPAGAAAQATIRRGDLLVLVDLFVRADVRFDRTRYVTGQRALLTCQVSAGGRPVTGARVQVELVRPAEGLGQFLVRHGTGYKPSRPQGADPAAPKAAMVSTLLRRLDLDGVPVRTEQTIFRDGTDELWDDGRHRDGPADDGTYANTYADLDMEGTYEWRFHVAGTTPDGDPFTRVATRSFWVGVGVDPSATKVSVTPGEPVEGQRTAQITVLPVDARGERLGPFRASAVGITSDRGRFLRSEQPPVDGIAYRQPDGGDLVSRYDGAYTRVLVYRAEERPVISVTVQGRRFPDVPAP